MIKLDPTRGYLKIAHACFRPWIFNLVTSRATLTLFLSTRGPQVYK
jgi:hypothetical protein